MMDSAIEICERSYELVAADHARQPDDHGRTTFDVLVVNYLLLLLQDKAEDLAIRAGDVDDPSYRLADRKRLYRRMTEISLYGLAGPDLSVDDFRNTALFGAAEHAALGSQVWEHGIGTREQIHHLVASFDIEKVISGRDTDRLHTAFRTAEMIVNNRDLARKAAERLRDVIENEPNPDKYQRRDLAQARAWLARSSRPPELRLVGA